MIETIAKTTQSVFYGSAKARQKMAEIQTRRFYDMVENDFFKKGGITKEQIKGAIKKLYPDVKVDVIKNNSWTCNGSINPSLDDDLNLMGYKLELPFNREDVLEVEQLRTLQHEIRHLFDLIYNPIYSKSFSRVLTLPSIKFFKYKNFYKKNLYPSFNKIKNTNPKIKKESKKSLENLSPQDRIKILQWWRYLLQTEKNACVDENIYGRIFFIHDNLRDIDSPARVDFLKHFNISKEKYIRDLVAQSKDDFGQSKYQKLNQQTNKKITMLERLIKKEISGERRRIAKNLTSYGSTKAPSILEKALMWMSRLEKTSQS